MSIGKQKWRWASSEARSLLKCTGLDDPVAAMQKLVDDLLQEAEQREAPIKLPVVASCRAIAEIQAEAINVAAMLVPSASGLRILVNANDPLGRRRFSAAHEICHTLFPSYLKHPVKKVDEFVGEFSISQEEEYLCDIGASYLLLPPSLVYARVSSCKRPCLDAVRQLADDFVSSLEAAAIAWTEASPWPCAIVFFEEALKPSQLRKKDQIVLPGMENDFRLEPELRITLPCASPTFPWFLPKYKSVGRDGAIYAALTQGRTQGTDVIELEGNSRLINTESLYAPYKREGSLRSRVVSFLLP